MQKYISKSEYETKKIAAEIAKIVQNANDKSNVIALSGELGAGKTTFVQGFAQELRIQERIISPTFVLIRQHKIPKTLRTLFHIDFYRLLETPNIKELGLEEIWSDLNNIVLIEWADKIKIIPKNAIKILIEKSGDNKRLITVYNT